MRKRGRDQQELVIRSLLARLGEEAGEPTDDELRKAARLASAEGRSPQGRPVAQSRPWRPLRLRWVAAGAAGLLVATGLGFGVASWITPTSSARPDTDVEGLGFLPAPGWTVVQAGLPGSAESARAVAANVPIHPPNPEIGLPAPALGSWPSWGILIVATLRARGDPAVDARFPVRSLPLRFADAVPVSETEHVLRAGVGGYNVEASIGFGSEPTAGMLRQADAQISRLVVAPSAITIAVRPTIDGRQGPLVVSGSVTSGKKDEKVTIQFKQCGLFPAQFRDHAEVLTEEGGGFSTETGVGANGVLRAMSGGDTSNEVSVQARPDVRLSPRPPRKYVAYVVEQQSFWRRQVLIQRFDRKRGSWALLKKLRLVHQENAGGGVFIWSSTDDFKAAVSRGTTIRAVLPLAQARPCHIGGYSNLVVTK